MTDLQYEFLCAFRASGYPSTSLLSPDQRGHLRACVKLGYLKRAVLSDGTWSLRITDAGSAAMLEHEYQLQQSAKQSADEIARQQAKERADRAQAVADKKQQFRHDFAVAAFGGLLALFVEHAADLVDFLKIAVEKALLLLLH